MYIVVICFTAYPQESKENGDFKLAVGLYNDGMYDLAVEQLKNFISAYPSTSQAIESRFYLGSAQMKLKRYDDARMTFQNFALTYNDNAKASEAWINVGDAYAELKNIRESASAYERVKVFHPASPLVPDALFKASVQYRRLNDREGAKRTLRIIIQDYPSSKRVLAARLALGEVYAEEGNTELAEREALRVSRSDAPADIKAGALLTIGKLRAEQCLFTEASESFASILSNYKNSPSSAMAAAELGILEIREAKYASALPHLTMAADDKDAEDSVRARALFALGTMYARQNDFSNAKKSFEKVISGFPGDNVAERAAIEAGRSAVRLKKFDDALAHVKTILAIPASDFRRPALVLAAETEIARKNYSSAAAYYNDYLLQFPGDPFEGELMMRLGNLYRENLRHYKNAITIYDQLVQRHPLYPEIADALNASSSCQEALNDFDAALASCKELQNRFPAFSGGDSLDERIDELESKTSAAQQRSVRELTSLFGDLLTRDSKADISFRLGTLYFQSMKDYRSAAQQFSYAIDNGINKERFPEAYYYRARSYHLLSPDDSIRAKAILYYDSFLKLYPQSPWSDDAAYYSYVLKSDRQSGRRDPAATKEFLAAHPDSKHKEELYLALGNQAMGEKKFREAIDLLTPVTSRPKDRSGSYTTAIQQRGKAFIALGRIDSAAINLAQASAASGADARIAEAAADLAGAYQHQNNHADAIPLLRRLSSEFYYALPARGVQEQLGLSLLANGSYGEAGALYAELQRHDQSSPFTDASDGDNLYFLASSLDHQGAKDTAKTLYRRYVTLVAPPRDMEGQAYAALGLIARAEGNVERASSYFRKAAAGASGTGEQSILLADQLFQTEQYAEAAKQYVQLSQLNAAADARNNYLERGIVSYLKADNLAEADKLLAANKAAFEKDKEAQAEFSFERGSALYRAKDYTTAKKMFDKVADDYEKTRFGPWGYYYLGKILEVSNKLQEAAKKYDQTIETFPNSDVIPRVLLSLGNMHFNAERFEEAIKYYQRILETADSTNDILPFAMNNLIEAYESTKLYDAAIKTVRQFLDHYPNDESVTDKRIKLGTLLTKAGYYDQAVANFQSILNEGESSLEAELRYDIGEAYYNKGDYQQAILEFLKVPYLVSKRGKVDWIATSFYMAGQSYEKISKFDEAVSMYQQIIDRSGIDATFKAGARKEIDRVKQLTKKGTK